MQNYSCRIVNDLADRYGMYGWDVVNVEGDGRLVVGVCR
jgi:hypothetical protein